MCCGVINMCIWFRIVLEVGWKFGLFGYGEGVWLIEFFVCGRYWKDFLLMVFVGWLYKFRNCWVLRRFFCCKFLVSSGLGGVICCWDMFWSCCMIFMCCRIVRVEILVGWGNRFGLWGIWKCLNLWLSGFLFLGKLCLEVVEGWLNKFGVWCVWVFLYVVMISFEFLYECFIFFCIGYCGVVYW